MKEKLPFLIEYVDNLGQGVSKLTDKICLVPKTLPGEKGIAVIDAQKSKVCFATAQELQEESEKRVSPSCEHYDVCQGCHYLHTSYSFEQKLKHLAYSRMFQRWIKPEKIHLYASQERLGYRNRVQLHYDTKSQSIGLINRNDIISVPNCKLPIAPIREKLHELYQNQSWKDLPLKKEKGHIELYQPSPDKPVSIHIDRPYAFGGFTQVYTEMMAQLTTHLNDEQTLDSNSILDLFGGSGSLSRNLKGQSIVVDSLPKDKALPELTPSQSYLEMNLYDDKAPSTLKQNLPHDIDWLILDPPRSGLKNIESFTELLKPKIISYVSCSPTTLVRDLHSLAKKYSIDSVSFYDFFPSTHHLEVLVKLSRLA